jgi:hypothetical protein
MQNNSGIKGGGEFRAKSRNLTRKLARKEPNARMGDGDITAPIVKSSPFNKGSESRLMQERRGGPQVGNGKSRIAHDSRTDGLIDNTRPKLDQHGDRMEDHGGFKPNTDMQQGNVLDQPKNKKGFNRDNQVMNPDESLK